MNAVLPAPISSSARRPSALRSSLWTIVTWVATIAVIAAVAWQFKKVLSQPSLWEQPLNPNPLCLGAAGALYLAGLAFSAAYWFWLLHSLGQRPPLLATIRAYYVGQLGRYVPGKVIGLGMRARLLSGPRVQMETAVVTVVYETLTTILSGMILALAVFAIEYSSHHVWIWRVVIGLAVLGVLLYPKVFNWVVERSTRSVRGPTRIPPVNTRSLLVGLILTACGWLLQGGTLWAVVESFAPGVAWTSPMEGWIRCTGYVAVSYAAGFLILASPGGLGVRDFLIQQFIAADLSQALSPEAAAETAVLAAVLVRLAWIVMDVLAAGICYCLPRE